MNLPALPAPDLLAKPPSEREPWQDQRWQRFWLSTQTQEWRTLALLPAGAGAPTEFTLDVAMALARTGMTHLGAQVHVADATMLRMASIGQFEAQVTDSARSGPVLIALAPAVESPVTQMIARNADCVVLCLKLGMMRWSDAKKTIRDIGQSQFIGSITVR